MRALLREEAAPEVISISKASDRRNRRIAVLLEAAGIVGSQGQPAPVVPPAFMPPVELLSWVGGEEARSPAATLQLAQQLKHCVAVMQLVVCIIDFSRILL